MTELLRIGWQIQIFYNDEYFRKGNLFCAHFPRIHNLTFHRRSKRFMCAFCNFDGLTVKDLNSHIIQDHEGNFNKCIECDFETWAHSVLRRHINVKHRKIKSSSGFNCDLCEHHASTKQGLEKHIRVKHCSDVAKPTPITQAYIRRSKRKLSPK